MGQDLLITIFRDFLKTVFLISSPLLLGALFVGLIVSIFQAATQIHEMTLVFVPKILIIGFCLFILSPWMLNIICTYAISIFGGISSIAR